MTGEAVLVGSLGLLLGGLMVREVLGFVRWRRDMSRLEVGEWSRVVRTLRNR